ncbi:probable chitinase 10 isoform X2 [Scylla paramamosain]
MSYDFHGNWEPTVGHPSPLLPQPGRHPHYNVQGAVDHLIKRGARPDQIVMGLPFYGVSWSLADQGAGQTRAAATGEGRAGLHFATQGKMSYYEICLAKMEGGWQDTRGAGGSYMHKDDLWVAYDDPQTLKKKAEYANMRGLAGVMIWDITTDDFGNYCQEGRNPLITAVANALQGTSTTTRPSTTTTPTPKPTQEIETEKIPNIPRRQTAARDFTTSPCIVRFDGTRHCPWDFTTTRGTTTTTPRRAEDQGTTSQTAYPWQA